MSDTNEAALNTDREVWSAGYDYRDERVHITEGNGIGISVGGYTIVKTAAAWHKCCVVLEAYSRAAGLTIAQEPKYTVNGYAIVNRASGEVIPADEPVFIFRARDKLAASVLGGYAEMCDDQQHIEAVTARFIQFSEWAEVHPERMKMPDTAAVPASAGEQLPETR